MILIDHTLISDDLIREEFVCNLSACKGACCEAGEMGAPLTTDEAQMLQQQIDKIFPFLSAAGRLAIARQGTSVIDAEGDTSTPLIEEGGACAYAVKDQQGIWQCAIEKAYETGQITLQKPVSCHLYPVRLKQYEHYLAVNYHRWEICAPACLLGKSQRIKVYQFLKDALVRKFGAEWYEALDAAAKQYAEDENH